MSLPESLANFMISLTQSQVSTLYILLCLLIAISSIGLFFGLLYLIIKFVDVETKSYLASLLFGAAICMLFAYSFGTLLMLDKISPNKIITVYSNSISDQYIFNGITLSKKGDLHEVGNVGNVQIRATKNQLELGRVNCNDFSLKDCFERINSSLKISKSTPEIIDIADLLGQESEK